MDSEWRFIKFGRSWMEVHQIKWVLDGISSNPMGSEWRFIKFSGFWLEPNQS
jgi:hypothetical protein